MSVVYRSGHVEWPYPPRLIQLEEPDRLHQPSPRESQDIRVGQAWGLPHGPLEDLLAVTGLNLPSRYSTVCGAPVILTARPQQ